MSTVDTLDISRLSVTERVALMERLWEALSTPNEGSEPPEWHAQGLRDREAEWAQRHSASEDWEAAKTDLRRTLP